MKYVIRIKTAVLFLFIVFLSGCGGKGSEASNGSSESFSYEADFQIISVDQAPYRSIMGKDGTVFFAVYEENEGTGLFYWRPGEPGPEEIAFRRTPGQWVTAMGRDTGGNILFACGVYEEEQDRLDLIKISGDGEILASVEITDIFKDRKDFEVQFLLGDDGGNYYMANGKNIYVVSSEGRPLYELECEKKIWNMFFSGDGRMMILHPGELEELSFHSKRLKPVKSAVTFPDGSYETGGERDILYSGGDHLYTCSLSDKEPTKLLSFTNNDISSQNLQCFAALEDGRIAAFTSNSLMERAECELILLKKCDPSQIKEKEIVTFGCRYAGSNISSQILRFNKTNKKYRVEVKLYGEEGSDTETARMLLQKDIASGQGPDLLDIGILFSEADRQELIGMDILEDLNPFFEKDGETTRESFLEQVLNIYEKDGYLYALTPSFGMEFLVGQTSDTGSAVSLSLDEMRDYIQAQPEEKRILPGVDRKEILTTLLQLNLSQLSEHEEEDTFHREELKRILALASLFPRETEENFYWFNEVTQIRGGSIPLMKWGALSVMDLQILRFLYDDEVNVMGYPGISGKGTVAFPCSSVIGICRGSEKKEGAWEFLSYLLKEEQQLATGISGGEGFPINRSALNKIFEKAMKKEYEKDEAGNLTEKSRQSYTVGNAENYDESVLSIPFYAASKEDVDRIRFLIDHIGNSMETNPGPEVTEIVLEEAEAFFHGHRTAEEATDIILDRLTIYMKERQ